MTEPNINQETIRNGQSLREWTVMCYFAGDDPLSALVVTQIKEIKDAGFQPDVDVLIHYDSNKACAPTRLYDVNKYRKEAFLRKRAQHPNREMRDNIGDGRDPFVRNFIEDIVDTEDIEKASSVAETLGVKADERPGSKGMLTALTKPDTIMADEALRNFVNYCQENHPAKHYLLVLFGHGMIVGSDAFLPDENPVSAISLPQLGEIVSGFCENVKGHGTLELLAMHSCSMGALEVAFQLKGTAKYMIASEGFSYVGAWPYRQLLKKLFTNVERPVRDSAKDPEKKDKRKYKVDPPELIHDLYYLALFGATDFMLSGYSLDLGLINLNPALFDGADGTNGGPKILGVDPALRALVAALKAGLDDEVTRKMIVAAHGQSQSYWGENYSDLYDFCECLSVGCKTAGTSHTPETLKLAGALSTACENVIGELTDSKNNQRNEKDSCIVHCSEYFGPLFQYSHGLSIYFPWSRPLGNFGEDVARQLLTERQQAIFWKQKEFLFTNGEKLQLPKDEEILIPKLEEISESEIREFVLPKSPLDMYGKYAINKEKINGEEKDKVDSWFSFLEQYWEKTRRGLSLRDQGLDGVKAEPPGTVDIGTGHKDETSRTRLIVDGAGGTASGNIGSLGPGKDTGAAGKDTGGTGKDTGGTGADGDPIVKNFPWILRTVVGPGGKTRRFPISEGLKRTFEQPHDDDDDDGTVSPRA